MLPLWLQAPIFAGAPSSGLQIPATNNNRVAYTEGSATTNHVRHWFTLKTFSEETGFKAGTIKLHYANRRATLGGTVPGDFDMTVRAALVDLEDGTVYRAMRNGSYDLPLAADALDHLEVPDLATAPGQRMMLITRVVAPAGTSKTYLISHGANSFRGEGGLSGTDEAVDFTASGIGTGARIAPTVSGGGIGSAFTVLDPGQGYTANPSVFVLPAAADTAARAASLALARNGAAIGTAYASRTPGTGFTQPPETEVWGGTYSPSNSQAYSAWLVTGEPVVPGAKSFIVPGDSKTAGYGSSDGVGDRRGNFGGVERIIDCRAGSAILAIPGIAASAWDTSYGAFLDYMAAEGITASHGLVALTTNDALNATTTFTSIQAAVDQVTALVRPLVAQLGFASIEPLTNSTRRLSSDPVAITNGGTGYAASSTFDLTLTGGTLAAGGTASVINVTTNASGVIVSVNGITQAGHYADTVDANNVPQALPGAYSGVTGLNTITATTGGAGSGFAFTCRFEGWFSGSTQSDKTGNEAGGKRDLINAAIRAGTGSFAADFDCLDIAAVAESAVAPQRWRDDVIITRDGLHESGWSTTDASPSGTTWNFHSGVRGFDYVPPQVDLSHVLP